MVVSETRQHHQFRYLAESWEHQNYWITQILIHEKDPRDYGEILDFGESKKLWKSSKIYIFRKNLNFVFDTIFVSCVETPFPGSFSRQKYPNLIIISILEIHFRDFPLYRRVYF